MFTVSFAIHVCVRMHVSDFIIVFFFTFHFLLFHLLMSAYCGEQMCSLLKLGPYTVNSLALFAVSSHYEMYFETRFAAIY